MTAEAALFEVAKVIMPLYIECSQQYIQLSIGAMALSVIFKEKILGEEGQKKVSIMLAASWALYLLSIGAGLLYQNVAIKNMLNMSNYPVGATVIGPDLLYGFMSLFFFSGSVLLIFASGKSLLEVKNS